MACVECPFWGRASLHPNPLHHVQADVVATSVIKLRRCVVCHGRGVLERAAVLEIRGDARRAERVVVDPGADPRRERPAPHHRIGVGLRQRRVAELTRCRAGSRERAARLARPRSQSRRGTLQACGDRASRVPCRLFRADVPTSAAARRRRPRRACSPLAADEIRGSLSKPDGVLCLMGRPQGSRRLQRLTRFFFAWAFRWRGQFQATQRKMQADPTANSPPQARTALW
jgi:hypothetical protein